MAGEKRSADVPTEDLLHHDSAAILLDVEGTTSSISFVQDTLFPYIREFLKKHVDEKWSTDEFKADFAKLKEQAKEDEEKKVDGFVPIKEDTEEEAKETLIKNVLWQMDNDRKTGALKQLQGHMWKAAHKPIKGHVYDDVPKAFEEWTNMGKKLYIYSSGSVEAQKLLYGDSVHGNLLKYVSGHFDTTVGPKQEADSYKNILKEIKLEPSNVLFLTDAVKEAQAAKEAGLATAIVIREGNAKLTDEDKATFKTIESFAIFQSASKRQKLEDDEESKKKDAPKEKAAVPETKKNEPMDTSEDVKITKTDAKPDVKVVESKVEKVAEAEKTAEVKESEKEVTPMEEDTDSEKKAVADAKTGNVEKSVEDKTKATPSDEKQTVDGPDVKKSTIEAGKEKTIEVEEKKSVETKETEKVSSSDEKTLPSEVPEKTEKETEKVTEKITEEVTDKIVKETAKDVEKEAKSEEKELKENGESKIVEPEQNNKTVDSKVEEIENKENVQSENIEEKAESKSEVAEETKETNAAENSESNEKKEKEAETITEKSEVKTLNGTSANGELAKDVSDEKVHTNGINNKTEKITENVESEESIKVKKAVADAAGETDVVVPPVVAATS